MKANIINFNNQVVDEITLDENVFNLHPRVDIIKSVIDWQLLKRMRGTHLVKTVSEVSGTTKKPFKQKGTGNARQGSLRSVQMRGGGVIHGPVVRDHVIKLPKKVRALGLKHALSLKLDEQKLFIIDDLSLDAPKTSKLVHLLNNFESKSFFMISGNNVDMNLLLAVKNISYASLVPQIGANVYDIIKHDYIFIAKDAINILQGRLLK